MHKHSTLPRVCAGFSTLAMIWIAFASGGCASKASPKAAPPIYNGAAPDYIDPSPARTGAAVTRPATSPVEPAERRLQSRIETLQMEVRTLAVRVEASERAYWGMMPADWQEKVRAAKADGTRSSERMRYLEAMETVLSRKLRSLQEEMKTYQAYQMSDPLVPRK
jgi:hypothetical protein